jgi:hypothetical protein
MKTRRILQQRHQRQHQHVSGEPGAVRVVAQAHADLSLSDAGDANVLTDEGLDSWGAWIFGIFGSPLFFVPADSSQVRVGVV